VYFHVHQIVYEHCISLFYSTNLFEPIKRHCKPSQERKINGMDRLMQFLMLSASKKHGINIGSEAPAAIDKRWSNISLVPTIEKMYLNKLNKENGERNRSVTKANLSVATPGARSWFVGLGWS